MLYPWRILAVILVVLSIKQLYAHDTYIYKQELKNFKYSDSHHAIFNRYLPLSIKKMQRDIHNYQELTFFQRLIRSLFLSSDTIIVTPETLPKLYAYVESVCTTSNMPLPTIFITRKKSLFNAFAQKLFYSTGSILIGQRIIYETTDDELEAIIAHEIGHIKYNHVNKTLGITFASYVGTYIVADFIMYNSTWGQGKSNEQKQFAVSMLAILATKLVPPLLINKRYEQEADQFAYEHMHKGQGIIDFFSRILTIKKFTEEQFDQTKKMIDAQYDNFGSFLYYRFMLSYYYAKGCHMMNKISQWIYYNTPFGPHPSPEARIQKVKEYLEQAAP